MAQWVKHLLCEHESRDSAPRHPTKSQCCGVETDEALVFTNQPSQRTKLQEIRQKVFEDDTPALTSDLHTYTYIHENTTYVYMRAHVRACSHFTRWRPLFCSAYKKRQSNKVSHQGCKTLGLKRQQTSQKVCVALRCKCVLGCKEYTPKPAEL